MYLEDGDIITITRGQGGQGGQCGQEEIQYEISNLNEDRDHQGRIETLELSLTSIEKAGYKHFMLKEILEQPQVLRNCLRGRVNSVTNLLQLGGILTVMDKIVTARRLIICACGTSWHSGLIGEYLIEDLARIPVEVEYASEFRYRKPILYPDDVVIVISQSGETADTLAAIREAKRQGCLTIGFVNSVGSTIARETDAGCYLHVGPEIGVASTKAFTAQITILALIALTLANKKGSISKSRYTNLVNQLNNVPNLVETVLKINDKVKYISELYKDARNFLYLGRGYNFPVALEGALKLKEISYIHAEGYPAAEMKHGPIALIDEEMPVVAIATRKGSYDKVVSNIQEVKARNGKIIAIVTEGDETVKEMADHVIEIPETEEFLDPLISVIPLQLLSYHIAVMRGCNVDQPRNLAKSVTVE